MHTKAKCRDETFNNINELLFVNYKAEEAKVDVAAIYIFFVKMPDRQLFFSLVKMQTCVNSSDEEVVFQMNQRFRFSLLFDFVKQIFFVTEMVNHINYDLGCFSGQILKIIY